MEIKNISEKFNFLEYQEIIKDSEKAKYLLNYLLKHIELANDDLFTDDDIYLIYSDLIGSAVADLGFKGMLTEGAKHVLAWKSPNYLYTNALNPRLKLLLKNFQLSDDIAFRFSDRSWSNWPLTADKYVTWLSRSLEKEEIINLFFYSLIVKNMRGKNYGYSI